jgi:hypothetical protein
MFWDVSHLEHSEARTFVLGHFVGVPLIRSSKLSNVWNIHEIIKLSVLYIHTCKNSKSQVFFTGR